MDSLSSVASSSTSLEDILNVSDLRNKILPLIGKKSSFLLSSSNKKLRAICFPDIAVSMKVSTIVDEIFRKSEDEQDSDKAKLYLMEENITKLYIGNSANRHMYLKGNPEIKIPYTACHILLKLFPQTVALAGWKLRKEHVDILTKSDAHQSGRFISSHRGEDAQITHNRQQGTGGRSLSVYFQWRMDRRMTFEKKSDQRIKELCTILTKASHLQYLSAFPKLDNTPLSTLLHTILPIRTNLKEVYLHKININLLNQKQSEVPLIPTNAALQILRLKDINFSIPALIDLLAKTPVEELHITNSTVNTSQLTYTKSIELSHHLPFLRIFHFSQDSTTAYKEYSDKNSSNLLLQELLSKASNLESFAISYCKTLMPNNIAIACTKLQELYFHDSCISSTGFNKIMEACPTLRKLHFMRCIPDTTFYTLNFSLLQKIEEFSITSAPAVSSGRRPSKYDDEYSGGSSDDDYDTYDRGYAERYHISGYMRHDDDHDYQNDMRLHHSYKSTKRHDSFSGIVHRNFPTSDIIKLIHNMTFVKKLTIKGYDDICSEHFPSTTQLLALEELYLNYDNINACDVCLTFLKIARNIKKLHIEATSDTYLDQPDFENFTFGQQIAYTSLHEIHLTHNNVTSSSLGWFLNNMLWILKNAPYVQTINIHTDFIESTGEYYPYEQNEDEAYAYLYSLKIKLESALEQASQLKNKDHIASTIDKMFNLIFS